MSITFTQQQQKVIDLRHRNILVSAAAGSGKTAVLVERIIQMVCDEENPVDIDRLLIVTFTNAAASEMRERISLGIAAKAEEYPKSEHIERQATLLHNALITTIDSFCLYLIKNHFHEIGLDPAFRVADDGEIKLLKQDVLAQLLESAFESKNADFLECVEFFSYDDKEKALEEIILKLHEYASSHPWPEKWLRECGKNYEIRTVEELEASPLGQYLLHYLKAMASGYVQNMEHALRITELPDGPYMYGETIEQEVELLKKLLQCDSLTQWETKLEQIKFGTLSRKKDASVNEEKKDLVKLIRDSVKKKLKALREEIFARLLQSNIAQIEACQKPVNTVLELTIEYDRILRETKQERKLLDFSDMEHYALDILLCEQDGELRPSKVALEYREYFEEILIDEYQDSNLVQEYLLRAISREDEGRHNRFMVGDVKQSVYRFRQARPELFLEKYHSYSTEEGMCQRIDLSQNFRSRDSVVNTVNHIFRSIMSKDTGGIEYDDKAALYVGADYYSENPDCFSELLLLEKPDKESKLDTKEAEGKLMAKKIRQLKQSYQVMDKESKKLRPVQYKDIVILLRATSTWGDAFKKVLESEGIPVYITSKTGYFAATEVQELLQFLRVLLNPRQDIPLYGVMKSVFGGFNEEEIALLRSTDRQICLWEKVNIEAVSGNEKCDSFIKTIEKYRTYTVYMSIRELLQTVVEDFSYLHYVTALPGGSKRKANVEMLFTKASDFENTSYFGLFHFVRYIEQLEKYEVDYGQEDMLDESADVVRIMTIHKSKGLEFPITFVAGLNKKHNLQDVNKRFLMDMDFGVATDYVNLKERYISKTLYRSILSRKLKEDTLAEELRVLYVALTRAKEKLIMVATMDKLEKKWESRNVYKEEQLSYDKFIDSNTFMDLLLPVIDEKETKVSFYTKEDLATQELSWQLQLAERKLALEQPQLYLDKDYLSHLQESFAFQYAYENLQKLYTKTTVSELKIAAMADKDEAAYHQFEEPEPKVILPIFMKEEEVPGGAVRGNAYHRIMELIDFTTIYDKTGTPVWENISHQIALYVQNGKLSKEYADILQKHKLMKFFSDDLAIRMCKAQEDGLLYREQPFVMGIAAKRLDAAFPEQEKVLIQGIIDAFFVENGEIVLLDYKTDRVNTQKELWDRYETQLDYYEEAISKLMQMQVKEKVLYSFSLEQAVKNI